MDNSELKRLARSLGFKEVFLLPPPELPAHDDEPHIVWNTADIPWVKAAALLVWAYKPYPKEERIPSYYINSNLSYHASVALAKQLEAEGLPVLRREVPIKQLAVKYGVGIPLKSSLIAVPPYGTRIAFQSLLLGEPFAPEEYSLSEKSFCDTCRACEKACPAHAITAAGYDVTRCMRHYMDGADYPEWVYGIQKTHLGCEICQLVCPMNASLGFDEPTAEIKKAFALDALAEGNTKPARLLVGKNMTGHGKLEKEAKHFLERDGIGKHVTEDEQ